VRERLCYAALFLGVSVALVAAFRVDKHLATDGAHYFATIADTGGFLRVDPTRWAAETLIQWPLVAAVRAGVTSIPALKAVFGLGIFLNWALSFALCLFATRREGAAPLALPILAMAAVSLPADFILAGEHHVMVLLAPPILLLVLRREAPTWGDGLALVLALLAFAWSYPTALVPALLFAALLGLRLRLDRSDRRATAIRAAALALSLAAFAIGLGAVIAPRGRDNAELFRLALPMVVHFPETLLPAAFSLLFLAGLAGRPRLWGTLAVVPLALYAAHAVTAEHGLDAVTSMSARTLSVTLLPPLLVLGTLVKLGGKATTRLQAALLAAMVAAVAVRHVRHTADWEGYRSDMASVLSTQRGFVPVEATELDANPCRWAWTSPQLSVIWSAPAVRAIVLNRADAAWQVYDPRTRRILERYVTYDPALGRAEPR
jgi:hypothetical protein